MKKFLIFSLCLISSFFIIDKASALQLTSGTDYGVLESQKSFLDDSDNIQQLLDNWWNWFLYRDKNTGRVFYNSNWNSSIQDIAYSISLAGDYEDFEYTNLGFTLNKADNGSARNCLIFLSEGDLPYKPYINATDVDSFNLWTMRSNTIVIYAGTLYTFSTGSFTEPIVYYFESGETAKLPSRTSQYYSSDITTGANDVYFKSNIKWNLNSSGTKYANSSFELESGTPEITYEIEDGSNYGKKLIFHFSNFDSNSYFTITNLSSGTTFTIDDLSTATDYFVDDISYDSVFYVEAYNNDELVFVDTIDINQDLVLNDSPYIDLVLDKGRLISYLEFYELKSSYKVYYSINNGTFNEVQVQSGNNHVLVAFTNDMPEIHNTNYTIRGQIRDSEDNILYDKAYNIVFFDNLPYFTFNTSYNNNTGCNEVNITYHNYQSGDIVQYSYDNSTFNSFSYDRYEYLDVCSNTPIYTKAVRGNNTYYGYFYVNVMEYESTSNEQYYSYNGDLFSTFNSLFNGVDISFLNNISSTWNSLKSTYVFKFILLCIVGAMILFIMKLIRR